MTGFKIVKTILPRPYHMTFGPKAIPYGGWMCYGSTIHKRRATVAPPTVVPHNSRVQFVFKKS
jgi:hypothetical protein